MRYAPCTLVFEGQGYTVDSIGVGDDHVEAVLVIHDSPETHDAYVYVIKRISYLQSHHHISSLNQCRLL